MTIDDFWNAVADNDTDSVSDLLNESPSLVNERFHGIAWHPDERKKPSQFPFTNTALHCAAVNSQVKLATLLLSKGADPNAVGYEDNKGLTPAIVLAAWEGSLETLEVLLDHGANPNLVASAESALYTAAEHGSLDKVQLLLERGAQHDIFTAAIVGDVARVRLFLKAYPTLREARSLKRARTPREEAVAHNRKEVVQIFESK